MIDILRQRNEIYVVPNRHCIREVVDPRRLRIPFDCGELVAYGGNVSDLQGMIEPLWTKYVTESNRSGFEVFVRGLPDKTAFFAMSQVLLRLIAS